MAVISMTVHKRDETFATAMLTLRTALGLMYALLFRRWALRLRSLFLVFLKVRALVTYRSRRIEGPYDSINYVTIHDGNPTEEV